MKLHEYQAREILAPYGVTILPGRVAHTIEEAIAVAEDLHREQGIDRFVVKAQIHAGGRGKGGGVKLTEGIEGVREKASAILGMQLVTPQTGPEGQLVRSVLIAEAAAIAHEYYVGITLDRSTGRTFIMASAEGGMDIEEVARVKPEAIIRVPVDPGIGFQAFQARQLAYGLGFRGDAAKQAISLISAAYTAYEATDASLVEINPLVELEDGRVLALDAKLTIDDNALYRHKDLAELRDEHEESPLEVEAGSYGLNYVKLEGNVGCMVNGAGLAMATMDIIQIAGGKPANFLDVGGGASATTVEAGFRIILKDPKVEAVLVNIFGGIVRCDRVATGIVEAARNVQINVPLIVRLQGTNAQEGMDILRESGLPIRTAILLKEAAERVTQALAEAA